MLIAGESFSDQEVLWNHPALQRKHSKKDLFDKYSCALAVMRTFTAESYLKVTLYVKTASNMSPPARLQKTDRSSLPKKSRRIKKSVQSGTPTPLKNEQTSGLCACRCTMQILQRFLPRYIIRKALHRKKEEIPRQLLRRNHPLFGLKSEQRSGRLVWEECAAPSRRRAEESIFLRIFSEKFNSHETANSSRHWADIAGAAFARYIVWEIVLSSAPSAS